jgi:hypothetical protein
MRDSRSESRFRTSEIHTVAETALGERFRLRKHAPAGSENLHCGDATRFRDKVVLISRRFPAFARITVQMKVDCTIELCFNRILIAPDRFQHLDGTNMKGQLR